MLDGRKDGLARGADLIRVDFEYPVVGLQAVEFAFDVVGLGVDRGGQAASLLELLDLAEELDVAIGEA